MNPLLMKLFLGVRKMGLELQENPRLKLAVILAGSILAIYGALELSDAIDKKKRDIARIRTEAKRVGAFSQAPDAIRDQAAALQAERVRLERRIGGYATDAIAQAAMAEWVVQVFKRLGVSAPLLSQVAIQNPALASLRKASGEAAEGEGSLRELKVLVTLPYSPETLLGAIAVIEGGAYMTNVDSLTVASGRVELGVRMLTMVGTKYAGQQTASPMQGQAAEENAPKLAAEPVSPAAPTHPVNHKILWN